MDPNVLSGVIGGVMGLVGSVIGYIGAMKVTDKANKHQLLLQREQEQAQIRGVVQALHDELNGLKAVYDTEIGPDIEAVKEGAPLASVYPLDPDYFTIYKSAAHYIGQIPDARLRSAIIQAYIGAKTLVNVIRYNNTLWQEYEEAKRRCADADSTHAHGNRRDEKYKELIDYVPMIKGVHKNALESLALFNATAEESGLLLQSGQEQRVLQP